MERKELRLLEIASVVNMLDGPLMVVNYLSNLSKDDKELFLSYVNNSEYGDLNKYDAAKLFSEAYLVNNNYLVKSGVKTLK